MKKLRIAQIAPLWFSVPPKKYGGIERIVAFLTNELIRRGHQVTLFAAPGSKTAGKLVSVYKKPLIKAKISWTNPFWNLKNLSVAYQQARNKEFDIIHSHLDLWTLYFQSFVQVPSVITLHNALYQTTFDHDETTRIQIFKEKRNDANVVFISNAMKKTSSVKFARPSVIHNGIDVDRYEFNPRGGKHFVWVSRIDKYKGIENAIAAAEKSGEKLLLAGRLDPLQRDYFKYRIKPRLNKKIRYIGELADQELSDFYGTAKAFLYPIEWEEPFGLVVAEAMACGTPVIAYPRGSMPELIKDGKTGFLVNNVSQLVSAMKKAGSLNRYEVRKHVEKNFRKEQMAENYEKLYYQLIKNK